jgi:hypothetical protein
MSLKTISSSLNDSMNKVFSRMGKLSLSILISYSFLVPKQSLSQNTTSGIVNYGFVKAGSIYLAVDDKNSDWVVDSFSISSYSTEKLSSFVFRDSSSFMKISENSSVVFEEDFFVDGDYDGVFEEQYSLVDNDGVADTINKTHFNEDFIKPYKYFPKGIYVLRNTFLQLRSMSRDESLGDLLFGTLAVNDNNIDGLVDEYNFQLNYSSGFVKLVFSDNDSNGIFEYSKFFIYDNDGAMIGGGDFSNSKKLISYLRRLRENTYLISSQGEVVERVR